MDRFPRIETARLVLSELHADDIPNIVKYAGNKSVSEYTVNIPYPYAEKDAVYWINSANQGFKERTQFIFAIRLKSDDQFIGGIGVTIEPRHLRAEIGYWIAEPFWNKGMMTEAMNAVIEFGFHTLGLNKMTANHLAINQASGRVMIKCGMTKEGERKEHILKNNVFHSLTLYALTKSEFQRKG